MQNWKAWDKLKEKAVLTLQNPSQKSKMWTKEREREGGRADLNFCLGGDSSFMLSVIKLQDGGAAVLTLLSKSDGCGVWRGMKGEVFFL